MRLADKITGPGWAAQRSVREPWFFRVTVNSPEAKELFNAMLEIPGCGYDGVSCVYMIPEEVLGSALGGKGGLE